MDPLETRLLPALRRECGIVAGSHGIVAVSGGRDSVATLTLLAALSGRLRLKLEVLHFDHGLRPESPREAEWVAAMSRRLGLPFHLRRSAALATLPSGTQAAARAWRRDEATRLAVQTGAAWIATGHQLDDHLETLVLKLLRGVHVTRLHGMASRQGLWVRPVLRVPRADLQAYLERHGLTWLDDPSNTSPKYKRNRVRRELLPLLAELADQAIGPRLLILERQSVALEAWVDDVLARERVSESVVEARPHWIDIPGLLHLPPFLQGVALHRFVQARLPGPIEFGRLEDALSLLSRERPGRQGAFRLDLPGGRLLVRRGTRLLLESRVAGAPGGPHQSLLAPADRTSKR